MESSEQDYRRLQKLVRQWRYVRWVRVLFGAVAAGFGAFLVAHAHKLSAAGTWNEEAITYYPLGMILFLLGFGMILPALAQWRGDLTQLILLRMARNNSVPRQERSSEVQDGDAPPGT
jgi:hypothetical protein